MFEFGDIVRYKAEPAKIAIVHYIADTNKVYCWWPHHITIDEENKDPIKSYWASADTLELVTKHVKF